MVFKKKVTKATKAPAVMVETKKMSAKDTCGMGCCTKFSHLLVFVLIVINTLLLVWILSNQTKIESDRVGGRANYDMVQQIYKSEQFKEQQATQIQQALQMYQGTAAPTVMPEPTVEMPTVDPTVVQ